MASPHWDIKIGEPVWYPNVNSESYFIVRWLDDRAHNLYMADQISASDVQLTIIDCARIDDPQLCVFLDCLVVGLSDIFPLRLVPSWTLPTMQAQSVSGDLSIPSLPPSLYTIPPPPPPLPPSSYPTPPAARPPHFIPLPPTPQESPPPPPPPPVDQPLPPPPPQPYVDQLHLTSAHSREQLRSFVEGHIAANNLDQWIRLPLLGTNDIMIYSAMSPIPDPTALENETFDERCLLLFPSLMHRGLGMRFRSLEFGASIELTFTDCLEVCPAGQVWVKCAACDKFHFPWNGESAHANSKKHKKKLWWGHNQSLAASVRDYATCPFFP